MVPIKRADRTTQIADLALKTEAALSELHHYCRFGRHLSAFPQKPYFLFSHCAHLVFSLWLDEQDNPTRVFSDSPSLAALFSKVDFGALRYADYSRRILYANAYEEHLKNEPKWFKFWIHLLQALQGSDAAGCEELSQQFLACLADRSLLDDKLDRRSQKALESLVQGPRAGRLLLHSIWILEDVISTISAYMARLDPASCATEQMQAMICLFSQYRRTIVWETAAKGRFSLPSNLGWDTPSTIQRLCGRRSSGALTVAPAEDGGLITCTYTPDAKSGVRERAWTRTIATLPCAYEELLFKTWPIDGDVQSRACWIVPAVEAGHLEAIAKDLDRLIQGFCRYPAYSGLVETATRVLRNGQSEWACTELPWEYVRRLDQLIGKLKFACREAKVLGGQHPAEKVVLNLWPPRSVPDPENATPQNPVTQEPPAHTATKPQSVESQTDQLVQDNRTAAEETPTMGQTPSAVEETPVADVPPTEDVRCPEQPSQATQDVVESSQEPEPLSIESFLKPACLVPQDRADPPVTSPQRPEDREQDRLAQVIGLLMGETPCRPQTEHEAPAPGESHDAFGRSPPQVLVWRLLEWHRPATEGNDREPLALVQLQHDLGWDQSSVLAAMGTLFGGKPFTLYRQKCLDGSIRRFLEDIRVDREDGSRCDTPPLSSSTYESQDPQ